MPLLLVKGIYNNNGYLGDAYISSENYKMAIEYYEKSLEMSTEIDIWL
jgi:tetratricopeptide (TPR) repeat protein